AQIHNCTIASNSATASGGGLFGVLDAAHDPLDVISTIIALNTAKFDPDADATFHADHDLIQNTTGAIFTDAHTITGKNPMLGSLAVSKGASVATMLLLKGSPALNAGINPDALTVDERGTGFARIIGTIDIGAAECG